MRPAAEVLSYDDDGNLTGDWRWTYVWDRENRLMSMTTTSTAVAAGAPNLLLDYAYDGFGRRVKKQVWKRIGTNWVLEEELRFVYEGWNLLAEVSTLKPGAAAMFRQNPISLTALGVQPLRTYLWGEDLSGTETGAGGVGGLLLVKQHAAAAGESWTGWQVPCLDGNGNVLAYLDADSGEVMSRFEYDPFGRTVVAETVARYSKKGTAAAKRVPVEAPPFRFSTKYEDGETGLVYYGFRYYAPEWGRWLSRDPIEESGGVNLYGMVENDAVNQVDYLGLFFPPGTPGNLGFPGFPDPRDRRNRPGNDDLDINVPPAIDGALKWALEKVMVKGRTPCTLRCYIADLSEEDTQKMLNEIVNSVPLEERQFIQDYIQKLPGSVSMKFFAFASTVHTLTSRTPQGLGLQGAAVRMVTPRVATVRLIRLKVYEKSVQIMGKNGAKYFGRLGSKVLPFVGVVSLGYEAVKACKCYQACEDEKFHDKEKIWGQ